MLFDIKGSLDMIDKKIKFKMIPLQVHILGAVNTKGGGDIDYLKFPQNVTLCFDL